MTQRRVRSGATSREHVAGWALAALVLALAGLVGSVIRPLAPATGPIDPALTRFDPAVLETIAAYREPRLVVAVLATVLAVAAPAAFACSRRGRAIVRRLAGGATHSPARAALVAGMTALVASVATLPASAWLGLEHDVTWGFTTQGPAAWALDWLLVSAGTWMGTAALAAVLVAAVARWPRSWPYRLTVAATLIGTGLVLIHPLVLQPVLLPTRPLSDAARETVTPVLERAGADDVPVVVGAASERTTRVNAQLVGLGPTERVVLYDTLLELPDDRIEGILAHELAHQRHRDLVRGVGLIATFALPGLLLLRGLLGSPGVQRLAGARGSADPRLLAVVVAAVAALELGTQPVVNLASRRAEAAADARAVEISQDPGLLIRSARTFALRDLSYVDPPTWVEVVWGSHPSVADRISQAVGLADDPAGLPTLDQLRAERDPGLVHPAITADGSGQPAS